MQAQAGDEHPRKQDAAVKTAAASHLWSGSNPASLVTEPAGLEKISAASAASLAALVSSRDTGELTVCSSQRLAVAKAGGVAIGIVLRA